MAAKEAGMSGTRWRHIVYGEMSAGAGNKAPVRGNARTLAQMAAVVGVTPAQLSDAGREDAAAELRRLQAPELSDAGESSESLTVERRYDDAGLQKLWEIGELDEIERRVAIVAIQAWRQGQQDHAERRQDRTG